MTDLTPKQVRRRRVFYIPGYDPIHPRRYRELYRKEGQEQAKIADYTLDLKPKTTGGPYGWHVNARIEDTEVEADFEVLVWSDIVKGSMGQSILATYLQLVRTAYAYIGSGALFRLMRLRKGPTIAALYPVVFLLAQLAFALVIGRLASFALQLLLPNALGTALGITLGLALAMVALRWFRKHDNKVFAYYLMHDYAYSAQSKGANPPELEARMFDFGNSIAQALTEEWDEILIVGHSSGAHLAVSILNDLIRDGRVPQDDCAPALGFLSLGQVVPMVSFLPDAHRLRRDLQELSTRSELAWIDVTAPGDGCAFALCDPVSVSGVAPQDKKWPLVISAAFTKTLSPERWKSLRWRFFRLHFQYLCAFDYPKNYDYFAITAGPQTLRARFQDRPPSKSRIERAENRYTQTL
jgi:hypothetical protein